MSSSQRCRSKFAENVFRRPRVFGLEGAERRKEILDDFNELVGLLDKEIYQEADGSGSPS
ncbi:hypothetical protein [Streptomyces adelaidensis]|uniref:hypothetical protein n=1 Tax=Streptomyces adelaidensis TaxID=2796465 RepID=UPI0019040FAE|nr:hypothetical protein [Streptomyces adelaidensis]